MAMSDDNVPSFDQIHAEAWHMLMDSATNPQAAFRNLTLCSVDADAHPQARMVVLRSADSLARALEFHTDTRSPKWLELSANPHTTVLGFCAQTRLQLRFHGMIELHPPGSEVADAGWDRLPPWTRATYSGGPPGDERAFEAIAEGDMPEPTGGADGKACFGVLTFRAATLDWFRLQRNNNRRAMFVYDEAGNLSSARWINP